MPSLDDVATARLARARDEHLLRVLRKSTRRPGGQVARPGMELISFSCNDYLGLSHDPRVIQAAHQALEDYGTGAGASRLVTGNHPLYDSLERLIAQVKGTERALVFGSGFLANLGVIPSLVGPGDLIVADRLCHASMFDAARMSRAVLATFEHNDLADCARVLETKRPRHGRCLIMTETVFSMDGDRAPIVELATLASEHDAWLLTDDAHGLGVCSSAAAEIQVGTLSKAVGGYGGYVAGSAALIEMLIQKAHTLIYTTGLPPATVAAAARAIEIIRDEPDLVEKPIANARAFTEHLRRPPASSAIVPVVVGSAERALEASAFLEEHGFLVTPIRPPSVPPGTARLRFAFSASHHPESIARVAALTVDRGFA